MALTPIDIVHTQFKTALKGYKKSQVDEFVKAVLVALEDSVRERTELQQTVDRLQEDTDRVREIERQLSETLRLAQKTADEVRANAHEQADVTLREAEQARVRMMVDAQKEIEKLRSELELTRAARDRFVAEFRALLTSNLEMLKEREQSDQTRIEVA